MAINLPQITKVQRTNAILFFLLTLLPIFVLWFVNKVVLIGFLSCVTTRYLELYIINKYGDKLQ